MIRRRDASVSDSVARQTRVDSGSSDADPRPSCDLQFSEKSIHVSSEHNLPCHTYKSNRLTRRRRNEAGFSIGCPGDTK